LGHRRAFALAAGLVAASVWGLNLSDSPIWWLALRFFGGFGIGAYYLLMESWISGLATPATRGRLFATYETLRIGAVALGPLLLVVASTHTAYTLIGLAFVMAIIPVARAQPSTIEFDQVDWHAALGLFACSPCTLTLTVMAGILTSSFYGFGAIYAEGLGFSRTEIALFVSAALFAPVFSQLPIGAFADRYGRLPTSVLVLVLAAVGAIILALGVPRSFLAVTATVAIVSSLGLPIYALASGRLVDGGHELIAATTAVLLSYNIGTFLGPFGAAFAMEYAGPAGLYAWMALCLIVGLCATLPAMLQPRTRCCPL
jgi:MFS family permease